jgi:proteasome beta subunit
VIEERGAAGPMTLPTFPPGADPGPSFSELLRRVGMGASPVEGQVPGAVGGGVPGAIALAHGTTIAALKYLDGVVMSGDRRATVGYSIAHRGLEKVFAADRYSGVAIAGTAGPALEMVRLFQTNLEHYEKISGIGLSLEGKANQLGQMVRENLPMAMQGLVVVPLFAGYDLRRRLGRIFIYDETGGRFEETEYHAAGSGGRDARTTIKLGFSDDMSRVDAIELSIQALYEAADEDAGTGGPDVVRGIYPTVATITAEGFERVPEEEVAARFGDLIKRKTGHGQSA